MVANIATVNGVQCYAGERSAWHGMGQVLGRKMTTLEAIRESGLADWDLVAVPTYFDDPRNGARIEEDRRVIFRTLDGQRMGNVGSRYVIVSNEKAFEAADELLQDGTIQIETAGALGNGERVWILVRIDDDFEVVSGDPIKPYCLLTTSHDGSAAVTGKLVVTQVVCQNTLAIANAESGTSFSLRHTTNVNERLGEFREKLGLVAKRQQEFFVKLEKWGQIETNDKVRERVLDELVPNVGGGESELVRERVQMDRLNLWKLLNGGSPAVQTAGKDSVWGTYTAATEWIDWLEPRKGMDLESTNTKGDAWDVRRVLYSTDGPGAKRRESIFKILDRATALAVASIA